MGIFSAQLSSRDGYVIRWATNASIPLGALAFRFHVPETADCEFASHAAGRSPGRGLEVVRILQRPLGRSWSAYTSGGLLHAAVGDVADTRPILETRGDRWSASHAYFGRNLTGNVTLTWAARGWEANPESRLAGGDAFSFAATCTRGFHLDAIHASRAPRLLDDRSMPARLSLALPIGHELQGGQERWHSSAADTRFYGGNVDAVGNLSLAYPSGRAAWELSEPPRFQQVHAGAGSYEVGLDCTCVGSAWVALLPMEALGSLDALDAFLRS